MLLTADAQIVALIISDCDDPSAARGNDDIKPDDALKEDDSDTDGSIPSPKKKPAVLNNKDKNKAKAASVKKEATSRAAKGKKSSSFVKKESRRSRASSNDSDSYTESESEESDELPSSEDDASIPHDDPEKPWTHTNLVVTPLSILTQWKDQIAVSVPVQLVRYAR